MELLANDRRKTPERVRGGLQSDLQEIFNTAEYGPMMASTTDHSSNDPCKNNPCDVNAICHPKDEKNLCVCKDGYFGNGFVCYTTICYSSPCLNGGLCVQTKKEDGGYDFTCNCLAGFIGTTCEQRVVPCIYEKPHEVAGGTCSENNACGKTKGYQKDYSPCERRVEDSRCKVSPDFQCKNDGKMICVRNKQTCDKFCECLDGFKGPQCEERILENPLKCENGGSYDDKQSKCVCTGMYDGVRCQERKYQSYMHFPRVHFAGWFHADVPTVNNILVNFNIHNFTADSAKQGGQGSWNPAGSGNFRMFDTRVTRVCNKDGNCVDDPYLDAMIGAEVKDGDLKAIAKMADIDVEVEGYATEIWGLVVHIDGFFKGNFQPISCRYLWNKRKGLDGTPGQGTKYQSVLTDVDFGPKVETSEVAKNLKELLGKKRELSISFNLDFFNKSIGALNFAYGRLVGSIGLSGYDSPPYFTYGRLLKPASVGVKDASYAPFTFDQEEKKLFIDLGNSLAIDGDGNILDSVGRLTIGYIDNERNNEPKHPTCSLRNIKWINDVNYKDHGGYLYTSGINVVQVSEDDVTDLATHRLILAKRDSKGRCVEVLLAEDIHGIDIQPYSRWVFRLQYKEERNVKFWVTTFGEMYTSERQVEDYDHIHIKNSQSILEWNREREPLPLGHPTNQNERKILENGKITIKITATKDPGNIRKYKDGQIYALEYFIIKHDIEPDWMTVLNTAILVLVWNKFTEPDKPTWIPHIQPIFQQYANLFPVMKINFMDLGNYYDVIKHRERIRKTMILPVSDPNFMPVTRDLSPCKTNMIVNWLKQDKPAFIGTEAPITVETLKNLLQSALQLEHATIPPYLSGYLSIKHGQNQEVKKTLRTILIDEMFHLAQVSNILNAIGGNPDLLRSNFILPYPSYLPGGAHPHVLITVDKISFKQIQGVYMEIEKPFHELEEQGLTELIKKIHDKLSSYMVLEAHEKNCTELKAELFEDFKGSITNRNTIGELYTAIIWVLFDLTNCGEDNSIFVRDTTPQLREQNVHSNINTSSPRLHEVTNLTTALNGIHMITEQGEGATPCNPLQADGTGAEISHYYAFASIIHKRFVKKLDNKEESGHVVLRNQISTNAEGCKGNFAYYGRELPFTEGGVWPIVKDPKIAKYKIGSTAYKLSRQFNEVYSRLLHMLQNVFNGNVDQFDDSMGLMKTLTVIGNQLVQTPIEEGGDPEIGPNAGPTYRNDN